MELFDFGMPALDKALNLTATVLLLLALGMLLIRVILRLCDRAFDRSERLAPFRTYLRSTLRAVLYILLALAVLGSIGVEITSFVALLSVAGLAVSLSLQNTLSNVAGGVMLLISKPFTVGDYVSCDGIEGAVRAVDLAYTTFTTVDNKEIFVPNSQIVTAKIVNYNALGRRRVDRDRPHRDLRGRRRLPAGDGRARAHGRPQRIRREQHLLPRQALGLRRRLLDGLLRHERKGPRDLCRPRRRDDLRPSQCPHDQGLNQKGKKREEARLASSLSHFSSSRKRLRNTVSCSRVTNERYCLLPFPSPTISPFFSAHSRASALQSAGSRCASERQ